MRLKFELNRTKTCKLEDWLKSVFIGDKVYYLDNNVPTIKNLDGNEIYTTSLEVNESELTDAYEQEFYVEEIHLEDNTLNITLNKEKNGKLASFVTEEQKKFNDFIFNLMATNHDESIPKNLLVLAIKNKTPYTINKISNAEMYKANNEKEFLLFLEKQRLSFNELINGSDINKSTNDLGLETNENEFKFKYKLDSGFNLKKYLYLYIPENIEGQLRQIYVCKYNLKKIIRDCLPLSDNNQSINEETINYKVEELLHLVIILSIFNAADVSNYKELFYIYCLLNFDIHVVSDFMVLNEDKEKFDFLLNVEEDELNRLFVSKVSGDHNEQ